MKKLSEYTNKELVDEFKSYNDMIYGVNSCYGTRDMLWLYQLEAEIGRRGLNIVEETKVFDKNGEEIK